ncbi:hypothetical protein KF840_15020 [bacterium]|nr:hypothetical protein [bacterium]
MATRLVRRATGSGTVRHPHLLAIAAGALVMLGAGAPTPAPAPAPTGILAPGIQPRVGRDYTLLDPTLALPPLAMLAPDLSLMPRTSDNPVPPPTNGAAAENGVRFKLDYRHAQLSDLSSTALRTDPATGFSRRLDTDVLALGMSWSLAGNQVGFAYQLQSARGGGGDEGLARFLPGSEAATHALTLGVTRAFGAGGPPPVAPPLLIIESAPGGDALATGADGADPTDQPTPSPAS